MENEFSKTAKGILEALKSPMAKKLLIGTLGLSTAAAAGTGGHAIGYRRGANKAADQMAVAFSEANTRENQNIVDSFKLFNKKENRAIAGSYLNKGVMLGARMHAAGRIKFPTETPKTASDISEQAFIEELEKLGISLSSIKGAGSSTLKALRGIGRRIGRKSSAIVEKGKRTYKTMSSSQRKLLGATAATAGTGGYALS